MEDFVAPIRDDVKFDFESFVKENLGLYFGEEGRNRPICQFFLRGMCSKGTLCPSKHSKGNNVVVCKHWMRGLCKKGDLCEFLHEYRLDKMPECTFYSQFQECRNTECIYLHIDPNSKIKECQWYNRGFCRRGADCRNKHVRKIACKLYLTGFCPFGRDCKDVHPKWNELDQ